MLVLIVVLLVFWTMFVDPYWFVTLQVMLGIGIANTTQLRITTPPVSLEVVVGYTMTDGDSIIDKNGWREDQSRYNLSWGRRKGQGGEREREKDVMD